MTLLLALVTAPASAAAPGRGTPVGREKPAAVSETTLAGKVEQRVKSRLANAARDIRAEERNGGIRLGGSVPSLPYREMAAEAAASVRGVKRVTNELRVAAEKRSDREIARDVTWALKSDPATLALGVDVSVNQGVVSLRGIVDLAGQKRIAEWVASGVRGVREVENRIEIAPQRRTDKEIHDELARHFAVSPLFNDDQIDVQVQQGVVSLSGQVDSTLEKIWARDDAWVTGVRQVKVSQLGVHYTPTVSAVGRTRVPDDDELRRAIEKAFVYDPRVASVSVDVMVENGTATLRGSVGTRRAREVAIENARNTPGVSAVIDRIQVHAPQPRTDDELAQAIRRSLAGSAALAGNDITIEVAHGVAVLKGEVDSNYEKWVAADLADRTPGVVDAENHLMVRGQPSLASDSYYYYPRAGTDAPWTFGPGRQGLTADAELAQKVRRELAWSPFADGEDIDISVKSGVVTLRGEVGTWAERGAAIENAYEAGAREVRSEQLRVTR